VAVKSEEVELRTRSEMLVAKVKEADDSF